MAKYEKNVLILSEYLLFGGEFFIAVVLSLELDMEIELSSFGLINLIGFGVQSGSCQCLPPDCPLRLKFLFIGSGCGSAGKPRSRSGIGPTVEQ